MSWLNRWPAAFREPRPLRTKLSVVAHRPLNCTRPTLAPEVLLQTLLALAATDLKLHSARSLLALPSVTADQLDRTPPDTH